MHRAKGGGSKCWDGSTFSLNPFFCNLSKKNRKIEEKSHKNKKIDDLKYRKINRKIKKNQSKKEKSKNRKIKISYTIYPTSRWCKNFGGSKLLRFYELFKRRKKITAPQNFTLAKPNFVQRSWGYIHESFSI